MYCAGKTSACQKRRFVSSVLHSCNVKMQICVTRPQFVNISTPGMSPRPLETVINEFPLLLEHEFSSLCSQCPSLNPIMNQLESKKLVFYDFTPCRLVNSYRLFERSYYLHLQSQTVREENSRIPLFRTLVIQIGLAPSGKYCLPLIVLHLLMV